MNLYQAISHIVAARVWSPERDQAVKVVAEHLETLRDQVSALEAFAAAVRNSPLADAIFVNEKEAPGPSAASEQLYPCDRCGKLRTKAQGGTVFTVCEDCWNACHGTGAAAEPEKAAPEAKGQAHQWATVEDVWAGIDYIDATQCAVCGACRADTGRVYLNDDGRDGPEQCPGYRIADAFVSGVKDEPQPPAEREATINEQAYKLIGKWQDGRGTRVDFGFETAHAGLQELLAERDQLRRELSQAEKERAAAMAELDEANSHRQRLVHDLCNMHEERGAAEAERDEARNEADHNPARWSESVKMLAEAETALKTSRALCDELRKACAEKEGRIRDVEVERDHETEMRRQAERWTTYEAWKKEKQRADVAEAALAHLRLQHDEAADAHADELGRACDERDAAEAALQTSRALCDELRASNAGWRDRCSKMMYMVKKRR